MTEEEFCELWFHLKSGAPMELCDDPPWWIPSVTRAECTRVHRGPEGPNEDLGACPDCWSISYALRPEGETFGYHLPDCSLPERHESYCEPGGSGHPRAQKIRGWRW